MFINNCTPKFQRYSFCFTFEMSGLFAQLCVWSNNELDISQCFHLTLIILDQSEEFIWGKSVPMQSNNQTMNHLFLYD